SVEALKRENPIRSNASTLQRFDASTLFKDVSSLLAHQHVEDSFDDWARQPLLPRRLSRLGPGVSWYDVDGDGWEDLILTGGRGGKLAIFTNDHGGNFRMIEDLAVNAADQGAVLGWREGRGSPNLL